MIFLAESWQTLWVHFHMLGVTSLQSATSVQTLAGTLTSANILHLSRFKLTSVASLSGEKKKKSFSSPHNQF